MKRTPAAFLLLPMAGFLLLIWGCPSASPPTTECAADAEACSDSDDCCEGLECLGGVCAAPAADNAAALPGKAITLDLIGIHDPDSDRYNDNCIACHGDRTEEVALDGVTPAAHATMSALFGEGNDRCVACHNRGPSFITRSAGGLGTQVGISDAGCANCHGAGATLAFYAK